MVTSALSFQQMTTANGPKKNNISWNLLSFFLNFFPDRISGEVIIISQLAHQLQ
jgi:hypothetical protein